MASIDDELNHLLDELRMERLSPIWAKLETSSACSRLPPDCCTADR